MTRLLSFLAPPATFAGSESEQRTYERARLMWLGAAAHVRGERFIAPTLGATVRRTPWWERWWTIRRAA